MVSVCLVLGVCLFCSGGLCLSGLSFFAFFLVLFSVRVRFGFRFFCASFHIIILCFTRFTRFVTLTLYLRTLQRTAPVGLPRVKKNSKLHEDDSPGMRSPFCELRDKSQNYVDISISS